MRQDGDARVLVGGTRPGAVASAFAAVERVLSAGGPPVEPLDPRQPLSRHQPLNQHRAVGCLPSGRPAGNTRTLPPGTAVVLRTSGSTGSPRRVALTAAALGASARATHARLGGAGRWLLALPIHHVAGWQVLVRSVVAGGGPPTLLDTSDGFDAAHLAAAVAAMPSGARRYTALVPTQLTRALAHPPASAALAGLDAVLVGGAATPPDLLRRARAAGIAVVTTYGMTETGGGCVYDGAPLDDVRVAAVGDHLEISGPTLATGYLDDDGALLPAPDVTESAGDGAPAGFVVRAGRRWLRTADLGAVDDAGHVRVLGRADDVLITGGVKVHPGPVERVLAAHPGIAEVVVVGVPDQEWGASVTAVVVVAPGAPTPELADVRRRVAEALGRAHAPRALVVVGHLPLRGPGKVDRRAAAELAAGILAGR